jgi:hypothetical protein
MCEECGEAPVQFVAYFNKPGGKHWRPPQRAAASPSPRLRGEGWGEGAPPQAETRVEVPSPGTQERADLSPHSPSKTGVDALMLGRGESAFVCEETRAE